MSSPRPSMFLGNAVRSGARSAVDVVEEHLAAIAAGDDRVHAFNLVMADRARTRAAEVDRAVGAGDDPGPLAGVPIALAASFMTAEASWRLVERPALARKARFTPARAAAPASSEPLVAAGNGAPEPMPAVEGLPAAPVPQPIPA